MKSVNHAMSLKRFMLRQEALGLYRTILRTIKKVPEQDRAPMKTWVREEFELHRSVQDEALIKQHLARGKKTFQDLQRTLNLATS